MANFNYIDVGLKDYKILDGHKPSKVVLLGKDKKKMKIKNI